MEDNEKKLFSMDELLEITSRDKKKEFNLSDVESIDVDPIDEFENEPRIIPAPVVEANPIDTEEKEPELLEPGFCIIDETSTSVTIEEGPDVSINEIIPSKKARKPKPTGKIKFSPLQIVLMAVLGVVALWFVAFTVDHTLAANGISPVFSIKSAEYEDQSVSYKGLGYKIQFKFDRNKNLTQDCVPFWKDGPNDIDHAENK